MIIYDNAIFRDIFNLTLYYIIKFHTASLKINMVFF